MPKVGQYIPGDSVIHNLDPRIKITLTFLTAVIVFFLQTFPAYGFLYSVIFFVIYKTGVPIKKFLSTLKGLFAILILTIFFNLFSNRSGEVLWSFKALKITDESAKYALKMFLRLVILVVSSSIMTMTTQPMDLTAGLESLFSPFKKFGMPVGEFAVMIAISLRFVPILQTEAERIYKAQISRGADFESGSFIERGKKLLLLLIPLFTGALSRADDLSVAMESRCFEPGKERTKRCPLKFSSKDYMSLIIGFLFLAGLLVLEKI